MGRRRYRTPVLPAALPVAAVGSWLRLGEPLHAAGFGLFLAPSLVAMVMAPGIMVSLAALPQLLVPGSWRIRWRHRQSGRPHIPQALRFAVYAADHWCCCYCGSPEGLQLDHVRPWSRGGLSVLWNLVTLCGQCNRTKSNYWVERDGYTWYRPFQGYDNKGIASVILRYELRHRWNPGRWIRAGWSLGT